MIETAGIELELLPPESPWQESLPGLAAQIMRLVMAEQV
jgi:hypothetical protein